MTARVRVAVGTGLLAAGFLAFVLHVMLGANGDRAWQDGRPPATVTVVAAHTYHVSSRAGLSGTTLTGPSGSETLSCYYTPVGGSEQPLTVYADSADSRNLHQLGSFIAPISARIAIRCDGVRAVYVDDAADAPFDWSGLMVVVSIVLGFLGAITILAGLRDLDERPPADPPTVGEMEHPGWARP